MNHEEINEYLEFKKRGIRSLNPFEKKRLKTLRKKLELARKTLRKRSKKTELDKNEQNLLNSIEAALKGKPVAVKPAGEEISQIISNIREFKSLNDKPVESTREQERFQELESELSPVWTGLKRKVKEGKELTSEDLEIMKELECTVEELKEALPESGNVTLSEPLEKGAGEENLPEHEETPKEEKPEKSCLIPWAITVCCLILAILIGLNWYLAATKKAKLAADLTDVKTKLEAVKKSRDDFQAKLVAAEAKLKECQEAAKKAAENARLESAMVREKGGIETVIINQLKSDPSLTKDIKVMVKGKVYDLSKKNPGDAADLLARNFGIVSGKEEVRVRFASKVAYLLDREGDGVVMKVYEKEADGFKLVYSLKTSAEKEGSFRGEKLQSFEYPYAYSSAHAPQARLPVLFSIQDLF